MYIEMILRAKEDVVTMRTHILLFNLNLAQKAFDRLDINITIHLKLILNQILANKK
jgi:hypothetical protein